MSGDLLVNLLIFGLMGLVGQGIRATVGLKSAATLAAGLPTRQSQFHTAYFFVSLMIGFIVGILAGLGLMAAANRLTNFYPDFSTLLGIAAAGYAGTDFIENAFTRILPGIGAAPRTTPPAAEPAPVPPTSDTLSAGVQIIGLAAALKTTAPRVNTNTWGPALSAAFTKYSLTSHRRMAAAVGQFLVEAGAAFQELIEEVNYTHAQRMLDVFPHAFPTLASAEPFVGRAEAIANRVYANRLGNGDEASGDGYCFRGRGLIQLTGRTEYTQFAASIGKSVDEVTAYCETPEGAAMSGCWYLSSKGCLPLADRWQLSEITLRVSGTAMLGNDQRIAYSDVMLEALGGSTPPPAAAAAPPPSAAPSPILPDRVGEELFVRVHYATDRNVTGIGTANNYYGSERGPLRYGTAIVSIPATHTIGLSERPKIWKFQFSENPAKHIVLRQIQEIAEAQFFVSMRNEIDQTWEKMAFVFVHGFNVAFADATRRTAQLAYDLFLVGHEQGKTTLAAVPILYSWPSKGEAILYSHDANNAEASAADFKRFLVQVVKRSGAQSITVIAHSMGNRTLTAALNEIGLGMQPGEHSLVREIVLAAPDIDRDVFLHIADAVKRTAGRITLYASSRDKALHISKAINGFIRLGDASDGVTVFRGADSIDASVVGDDILAHSYYGQTDLLADLHYLLKNGLPPDERFGLLSQGELPNRFWLMRPRSSL
jgi:esterase/lipase superfamily enzyme/predicted chitinase